MCLEIACRLTSKLSATELGVRDRCASRLMISLLVGSAIAWNTSRLISLRFVATKWLQMYVQSFGCASVFRNNCYFTTEGIPRKLRGGIANWLRNAYIHTWEPKHAVPCRRDGPSQMRGWPGMWVEAYLALDFFVSFCIQDKKKISNPTLSRRVAFYWLMNSWLDAWLYPQVERVACRPFSPIRIL